MQITTSQYKSNNWVEKINNIINEQAVILTVNDQPLLDFMCTPIDLDFLAIGFLFNEVLIETINDILSIHICDNYDQIDTWLNHNIDENFHWVRTSGCTGGYSSIDMTKEVSTQTVPEEEISSITPGCIISLIDQLFQSQSIYRDTGGIHTSAASDGMNILYSAEDIGRHNTLDKLAGRMLQNNHETPSVVLTTGRVSSDMMKKIIRMGFSIVISRTSPTTLSIQHAEKAGITLIGYARRDSFIVYTHPQRILK